MSLFPKKVEYPFNWRLSVKAIVYKPFYLPLLWSYGLERASLLHSLTLHYIKKKSGQDIFQKFPFCKRKKNE